MRRPKSEGGAGRRGPDGPTGPILSREPGGTMLFDEAPSGIQNRKSAISPASRARCLKPAPHDPRWTDLSGGLGLRRAAYPPLVGTDCTLNQIAAA